jgi:hypothetical protein
VVRLTGYINQQNATMIRLEENMPERPQKLARRREVLGDHKRIGKRFVPPFLYQLGPLTEISWVDKIMPEILWIGFLIDHFGYQRGVELGLHLSKSAVAAYASEKCEFFGWNSSFDRLSTEQKESILWNLDKLDVLADLLAGLRPLLALYPSCPLYFLAKQPILPEDSDLDLIRSTVEKLYARRDVFATRVQSTVVYFSFIAGCLKVSSRTSLADFPEVERYPDTEKSKQIAANVRAVLNLLYGEFDDQTSPKWPLIFWNHGLALEDCRSVFDAREE